MPYHLLLTQLVYTSFAETGFRTLASAEVPAEIQQAFMERVVAKHWDSYTVRKSGYRAVYLYQVTPEHNLFGWLYNDGEDAIGRSDVPYFICYYLAEPLLFYFQLASIFNCLHKGPVALIDRHSLPATLETIVVRNSLSYQPARPGVAISSIVRARSHIALKQGELLDLFVDRDEQEMVVELNAETEEQQIANLSIYTRYLVEDVEKGAVTLNEDAAAIKARVIKPYQGYKEKLQRYEKALVSAIQREYPISDRTDNSLKRLQQDLRLRTEDVEPIKARSLMETVPSFNIGLDKSVHYNSVLPYRNSQLLLKAGIAAIVLVFIGGLIYGLVQKRIFVPRQPEVIPSINSSVFYKTLAEVPNVPQGVFNYGGSTTFAPLRSKTVVSAINQAHPRFYLRYTEPTTGKPGSGKGLEMLLKEQLSFAQSSRPVKNEEFEQAKQRGFTLKEVPVAIDGIAVYVNPQFTLQGLTLSQVKDIFTGKITNWKAVGGPDLKIIPFSRNLKAGGTVDFFYEEVLNKESFGSGVQEVLDTTDSIRKVATTPGGIGYATASHVVSQHTLRALPLSREANQPFVSPFSDANATLVNKTAFANGSYPITRRLFVVIKQDGGLDENAGRAYANLLSTNEGQQLVEKAGFVAIR